MDGSSPAVSAADGTVYVGSLDSNLHAIHRNGTEAWVFKADSNIQSSPAIGSQGRVYFASFAGTVYSINPAAGTVHWTASLHAETFSSPALGYHGLYIGDSSGSITAFTG